MSISLPPQITRRRFLTLSGGALALGLTGYSWRIEPHWVQEAHLDLPIRHLPEGLVGRNLVQISDLHVGSTDREHLKSSMRLVSSLEPDLVVITGDFMTSRKDEQVDNVARVLEYLESPPLGCFAVLGNHDYGPSWFDPDVAARLHSRLSELGIAVLRNSSQQVEGLLLVGLDDYWGPNFRPRNVLSKIPPEQASLVLCHNPDAADQPVWSGYRGWILAGHTHGGQCKPPFLRSFTLPVKNSRYSAGVVDLHDGRMLYINPGLGYLRRVRFNVRPEVTVFRLTGLH